MVGITTLLTTVERVRFVEFGIEVIDVTFSHLTGNQIKPPAVVIRLKAHIGQHVR